MKNVVLFFLVLVISSPLAAQQAFSSLEEQMSGGEFEAAGLEKLSPAELATLNNWIRSRSLATLEASKSTPAASNEKGQRDIANMKREEFSSRLIGTFTGWDGQAVFKLENGQIWVQSDKDKFYVKAEQNPMVTIKPSAFKRWRLSVEGHDADCKVKRIQ